MHGMAVFSEDIRKENEGYFKKGAAGKGTKKVIPLRERKAIIITDRKNVLHYVMKKSEARGKISYIS